MREKTLSFSVKAFLLERKKIKILYGGGKKYYLQFQTKINNFSQHYDGVANLRLR